MTTPITNAPAIDANRLWSTLQTLGLLGDTPRGMERIAFSPAELAARAFLIERMREAGLDVRIDAAANLIGRRAGSDESLRPIALGSHIDTVPRGGKYDGALGVIGALEVCRTLSDLGLTTRHPLEVLAFTNEEGGRFHRGLFGSRAMAGLLVPDDLTVVDEQGKSLAEHLLAAAGDLTRIAEAERPKGDFAAYLELHVEQGSELFRSGTPIGVVTGITGRYVFDLAVRGFANHAGTTPMDARQDAMVTAARVVLAVKEIAATEKVCRVSTVGVIRARPGAVNVIPGEVDLEAEFRDLEMSRLDDAEKRLREVCAQIASETRTEIAVGRQEIVQAAPTGARMREAIERAAAKLGLATQPVPSGAGHDAQAIAALTEIGMIFVPSVNGISHSPEEFTPADDCARGTNVLLLSLLDLDEKLDGPS